MDAVLFQPADALPTLRTPRLTLRQLEDRDVPRLFEIFSDPEVMRYWSRGPLQDVGEAQALLEEIRAGLREQTLFQWGIALAADDRVIGTTTLFAWERAHRRAEIGFALRRSEWRKGYGLEAVRCAVDFAFEHMNLHRLEADCDPRNQGSLGVLTRLGFRAEGLLRERYLLGGEAQDAVLLGLLRNEWHAGGAA